MKKVGKHKPPFGEISARRLIQSEQAHAGVQASEAQARGTDGCAKWSGEAARRESEPAVIRLQIVYFHPGNGRTEKSTHFGRK